MADMYEQYYQSKLNEIKKKKDQGLADLATEEQGVNNTYTDLYNQLQSKQDEGKQTYYGQKNQAAVSNAQNVQQIRDWMARNNLLQSGESADQLMRSNTDFSNNLGNINTNETNFNRDIINQRGAANREQAQKIADILNRRRLTEDAYTGDEAALRSEVEYQKLSDQRAAQEAAASRAASAARSRASSAASAAKASTAAAEKAAAAAQKKIEDDYDDYLSMGYKMIQDEDGMYDNDTMVNWVNNSDLPEEYKAKLANTLNLHKPVSSSRDPYYIPGVTSLVSNRGGR